MHENPVTHLAAIRHGVGVEFLVGVSGGGPRKLLAAVRALVGSVSRVNTFVGFQVAGLLEPHATESALVRFQVGMDELVGFKIGHVAEEFEAELALVSPDRVGDGQSDPLLTVAELLRRGLLNQGSLKFKHLRGCQRV